MPYVAQHDPYDISMLCWADDHDTLPSGGGETDALGLSLDALERRPSLRRWSLSLLKTGAGDPHRPMLLRYDWAPGPPSFSFCACM